MLREIVIRMLGHFEYNPEDEGFVVLVEDGDIDRVLKPRSLFSRSKLLEPEHWSPQ